LGFILLISAHIKNVQFYFCGVKVVGNFFKHFPKF